MRASLFTPQSTCVQSSGNLRLIIGLAALALTAQANAQVNLNINKEVWKQKYGVLNAQMAEQTPYAGWLNQDADGDGVTNGAEFTAGTNPFNKLPTEANFRAPSVTTDTSNLSLTFPTVPGKAYSAESNPTLLGAWSRGTLPGVTGDGSSKTLIVPKSTGNFFRLTVSDQASQSDQVSDWAKLMLGLSAAAQITSQTSFDHSSLAANLTTQNVVSISAIDTAGTQPADNATPAGDFGLVRISRSGYMTLGAVTVRIYKSGTAVEGVDYTALPTSVTFPVGVNSLDLKITPRFNASRVSTATVFLTLASPGASGTSGNYTLGSPAAAGVTIYPSASPTGTGLSASYYIGSSSTYSNPLNFGGLSGTYSYTKVNTTSGNAVITYVGTPATAYLVDSQVQLQFTSSTLNVTPYNSPAIYTITALGTNSFTIGITGTAVPSNSSGTQTVVIGSFYAPLTRLDPVVDFTWGTGSPAPSIPVDNFSARWTGQILPQYSQTYYIATKADDGSKLWINNQLVVDQWSSITEKIGTIDLQAGVYYDIKMESREASGSAEAHLSWYSDDQVKQIVPANRLFPTISGNTPQFAGPPAAPPAITSSTSAVAILGAESPFTMNLTSSNGGIITSADLPNWLTLVNGVLSGTPPAAGIYQFTLTTTNATGTSSVVMTIEVLATPNNLTRDLWTSAVTGAGIANVPWTSTPSATSTVTTAQSAGTLATNTGERLRGYFTAPVTGNYYFWIAANNAAELWVSNNSEPVNKVLRASVTGPTGSPVKTWNSQTSQKSRWLSLTAGQKYYIEALHNSGSGGAASHLSLAWFLDLTGSTASPVANGCPPAAPTVGGIISSPVLSPWDNPPTITVPGTLYVTNLQGATGVTATGGAFLRVNGSSAILHLNHTGLTSGSTSRKIHNSSNAVIFDINAQERNYPNLKTSDDGYTWNMQAADLTDLNNGGVYLKISTLDNPSGEISGTFGKIAGSQTAPPVPAYPSWTSNHATSDTDNSRFLTQATFGPSVSDMNFVKANGYRTWIENQISIPPTRNVPFVLDNLSADPQNAYGDSLLFNSWWKNSVTAPDQLRQRAAFALSEILVISSTGPLSNNGRALADYYDTLLDSCFDNFRDILKDVTLSPAMGVYLDMRANAPGDLTTGLHPNENYAREVLQLFSSGLYRTWQDGTLVLDSSGNAVPTYDQSSITGFARVFTGWNWGQSLLGTGRMPTSFSPSTNYLDPMVLVPSKHELGSKILLDNVIIPPATNTSSSSTATDPVSITIQTTDPLLGQGNLVSTPINNQYDLNGLKDLETALDNIMANSAVAPFICRQLIQRLVTSHPKPAYVQRVVRAFNGEQNIDGIATGVRGDMAEVFRSILLDYEARSGTAAADPQFGKQREPVMRLTGPARSLAVSNIPNCTYSQAGTGTITVTTPTPHRLTTGESVRLANFVDSGSSQSQVPSTKTYVTANVTTNSFTVINDGTSTHAYTVSGTTVSIAPTGVTQGNQVYVSFSTGGLAGAGYNGVYTIGPPSGSNFTITLPSTPASSTSGNCLIPKFTSGYNATDTLSILIQTTGNHNLTPGDLVQLKFLILKQPLPAQDGVYTVASVQGSNAFRVTPPSPITKGSEGGNSVTVFPLKGSQWNRTGTVSLEFSTWSIGKTESNLNQTPLNSPSVFNFFYPDYQYPGAMAQLGMTTPEFQLTNDSNTMNLTNLITQGTQTNNTANKDGYINFLGSNSIVMDLAPYMAPAITADAAIPTLVENLNVLLASGNLSSSVKNTISTYVANTTNFPMNTPTPTNEQMRNRVRAIVNLITISSEYAIQK